MPGITVLETPGHTPGCMSLQLDLADTVGPPALGAAIVWDNQAWLRSVEKLRGIAERADATLVFGHDPELIGELRIAPAGSYT